ncbi:BTB/POZ and MATH domain-containing protein 2-like [Phragmites australis]|uniref:BTB/POZ and MATH domain-containing protein 2-like n=1 Tax=Phragmites australis TaxID=29695 RepID=UPI002D76BDA5|nr:BTB/POZ and MATH domain-containing protein 2-like [Phragmites australis]
MPTFDSASAIVGGIVTGRHLLHIEGYSHTKELSIRGYIESRSFRIGGRTWCIWYYPNGIDTQGVGYISIYIILKDDIPEHVYAETTFNLLDQAGEPVPGYTHTLRFSEYSFAGDGYGFIDFIEKEFLEASEYLVDDCFKIRCDISVSTQLRTENRGAAASTLAAAPPSDLQRHLGDLLVAKEGADITFQVAGETFSAHRCILAARSPVFKAEFYGAMRESTATGVCVRIDDMEPQVFSALLNFIYTDSLPEMTGQEDVVMAQHLLEAADRYDMQSLKLICVEKLCIYLDANTAATTLVLAEQHHCHRLKKACIEFLKSPQALDAVMATDGFDHLIKSYPALLKELISKLAAR